MIVGLLLSLACGFAVAGTGPAFDGWRARRRARRDYPRARVEYLPAGALQPPPVCANPRHEVTCALVGYCWECGE